MTFSRSPTLLLDTNMSLQDALGRPPISLPFEHFRYFSVFKARLREVFRGAPGEDKVLRNQYHVIDVQAPGTPILTEENWSQVVKPGMHLAMSIFLELRTRSCPSCHYENISKGRGIWISW